MEAATFPAARLPPGEGGGESAMEKVMEELKD